MYRDWSSNNTPKRRRRRTIAIGDLNARIVIQKRVLNSQFQTGTSDMMTFSKHKEVWACVETATGATKFDGVEIKRAWTHNIYIRYRNDLDTTNWILWRNRRFKIITVEDMDERREFLHLRCSESGTSDADNLGSEG